MVKYWFGFIASFVLQVALHAKDPLLEFTGPTQTSSAPDTVTPRTLVNFHQQNVDVTSPTGSSNYSNGDGGDDNVEDDIVKEGYIIIQQKQNERKKRAATAVKEKLWPNATIPYVIGNITDDVKRYVLAAMQHWEKHTCIRFVTRSSQHVDYIVFVSGRCGCCSLVGRKGGGSQDVTLSAECATYGVAVHELGHVVGFWHEHSRPDRDRYIEISRDNVAPEKLENFDKKSTNDINTFGEPYDFNSIMHYSQSTFSKNGKDTLIPKLPGMKIGQRRGLSPSDIAQTRMLYRCPKPHCYVEFNATEQSFMSPNYPDNYFKDYECTWVIWATMQEMITLQLMDFSVEKSTNCTYDYLELREGSTSAALQSTGGRLVGRLCGDGAPGTFHSRGTSLWIKFVSDASQTSRGFWAHYVKMCTIFIEEAEAWRPIIVRRCDHACIHWLLVLLDESDDSSSGALDDWEDVNLNNPGFTRNSENAPTVYIANCNRLYTRNSGTISSPLMPVDYRGTPVDCIWTIDGGRNASRILLTVDTAQPDIHQQQCLGYIYQAITLPEVRSVPKSASQQHRQQRQQQLMQHRQVPSTEPVNDVLSRTRRSAHIEEHGANERYGLVRYDCLATTTLVIATHRLFVQWTSLAQQAISFSYVIDYDECGLGLSQCDHKCENTLTGYRCTCELGYSLQPNGRSCLRKIPETVDFCASPDAAAVNLTRERGGISVNLGYLAAKSQPSQQQQQQTGILPTDFSSSEASGGSLQSTFDCQWRIQVPDEDTGIVVQFTSFNLPTFELTTSTSGRQPTTTAGTLQPNAASSACNAASSYVEVQTGLQTTRYCGTKLPQQSIVVEGRNDVIVRLKAVYLPQQLQQQPTRRPTSRARSPQFSLQYFAYRASSVDCDLKIRLSSAVVNSNPKTRADIQQSALQSVEITSPDYPKPYPGYAMCSWRISTRRRSDRIRLTLVDVDIERTDGCRYDFLDVRLVSGGGGGRAGKGATTGSGGSLLARYCGSHKHVDLPLGNDSQLILTFVTDGSGASRGFRAIVTSERPEGASTSSSSSSSSADGKSRLTSSINDESSSRKSRNSNSTKRAKPSRKSTARTTFKQNNTTRSSPSTTSTSATTTTPTTTTTTTPTTTMTTTSTSTKTTSSTTPRYRSRKKKTSVLQDTTSPTTVTEQTTIQTIATVASQTTRPVKVTYSTHRKLTALKTTRMVTSALTSSAAMRTTPLTVGAITSHSSDFYGKQNPRTSPRPRTWKFTTSKLSTRGK